MPSFLLTDIEGSTALWEQDASAMREALVRHDELVGNAVAEHAGSLVKSKGEGDSTFNVFQSPQDAVSASVSIQLRLAKERWPTERPIIVRAAVHTGEAEARDGDFFGRTVIRCARIRSATHGGQVLVSEETANLTRSLLAADLAFLDLGWHRLKDLSQPEHLFQITHPSLPQSFPAPRSIDVRMHNLPFDHSSFVGRDKDRRSVASLLESARMVSILGPGGVGKTRLALRIATDRLSRYEHGVWFADLAKIHEPSEVSATVATAMGIRVRGAVIDVETLGEELRGRSFLLVLDNCEHVLGEAARIAEALVQASPDVHVLATSRERLGLQAETMWRVAPLAVLDDYESSEALRLFRERALQADPHWEPAPEDLKLSVEICRRLGGLPLAIELAASFVGSVPLTSIADRVAELDLGERTGGVPHQRTLRSTIAWSLDLLHEEDATALPKLSVFAGGFDSSAAEAVMGAGSVGTLSRLADRSLVIYDRTEQRYSMLEPIRQYGMELLEGTGERDEHHRRHFEWFADLALAVEPALTGGPRQLESIERLHRDEANLRAAFRWALEHDPNGALALATNLWRYWEVSSAMGEWGESIASALERAVTAPRRTLALGRIVCGVFFMWMRELERAQPYLESGVREAEALDDDALRGLAFSALGLIAQIRTDLETAADYLRRSVESRRRAGRSAEVAMSIMNIGVLEFIRKDYAAAENAYNEGLAISREAEDSRGTAISLANLGELDNLRADYIRARRRLADAVELFHRLGDLSALGWSLRQLALALARSGHPDRAVAASTVADSMLDSVTVSQALESGEDLPEIEFSPIGAGEIAALREKARSLHAGDIVRLAREVDTATAGAGDVPKSIHQVR